MIQWSAVSWDELEPVLRKTLQALEVTEPDPVYRDEDVRRDRDPVQVARDILNMLGAQGYYIVRAQNHEELGL